MGISFLESFKAFILAKIGTDSKDYDKVKAQDASLFYLYANDFKDFIAGNSDLSIFSDGFKLEDLTSMSVSDGKLTAPEGNDDLSIFSEYFNGLMQNDTFKSTMDYDNDGEFTIKDFEAYLKEADADSSQTFDVNEMTASFNAKVPETKTEETTEETTEEKEEEELSADVKKALDSFYSKEEVIKALDTDGDGKLSDEEKTKFEKYLKECFKDGITVDNINKALDAIKDGSFSYDKKLGDTKTEPPKTPEKQNTQNTQNTQSTNGTGGTSGGGYVPSSGGGTDPKNSGDDKGTDDKPTDLSSMSLEQLNSEKSTRESTLKDKQEALGELQSGGGELKDLKQNVDDAFDKMTQAVEKLDKQLSEDLKAKQAEIAEQEKAISQKEGEITTQEGVVADAKTSWDNAKSKTENLKASKAELDAVDTSDYTAEQKAELEAKKSELEGEISTAEQEETDAETKYNEATEALDKLKSNDDGTGLKQLQEALDKLNSDEEGQMGDLQKKVSELGKGDSEEAKAINQAKQDYDKAKTTYETKKTELISKAQDEVTKAQAAVDEVNVAIQNYKNKEDKDKFKNPVNDIESVVDFARQFDDMTGAEIGPKMQAAGYAYNPGAWCADFVAYVFGEGIGYDNVPSWYANIENKSSPGEVYQAGIDAGKKISLEEAKPGDIILVDHGSGTDHIVIYAGEAEESGRYMAIDGNTGYDSAHNGQDVVDYHARKQSEIYCVLSMH